MTKKYIKKIGLQLIDELEEPDYNTLRHCEYDSYIKGILDLLNAIEAIDECEYQDLAIQIC